MVLGLLLSGKAYAHEGKHKPLVCILESERTEAQRKSAEVSKFFHRLGKLDEACLIIEVEMKKQKIIELIKEKYHRLHAEDAGYVDGIIYADAVYVDGIVYGEITIQNLIERIKILEKKIKALKEQ